MAYKIPSEKQKKKIYKFLTKDEKVVLVTTISKRYFWIKISIYLVIPLALTYASFFMFLGLFDIPNYPWIKFLGIFPLVYLLVSLKKTSRLIRQRQSYVYALTNRRFLIITGIFSRKIITAPLQRITHVTVEQSFIQRFLFGNGNLVIITAGYDQREIVIENIGNPVEFKIMIEELTDKIYDDDEEAEEIRSIDA